MRQKILEQASSLLATYQKKGTDSEKKRRECIDQLEKIFLELKKKGDLTVLDLHFFRLKAAAFVEAGTDAGLKQIIEYWRTHPLLMSIKHAVGIGPSRGKILNEMNIFNMRDLLMHYPRRYEDRSQIQPISDLVSNQMATVIGTVQKVTEQRTRGRLRLLKAEISDATGVICGIWFNQPYLKQQLKSGSEMIFSGKVEKRFGELQMQNPAWEMVDVDEAVHNGRIVPVYSVTEKLNQKVMRRIIKENIENSIEDWQGWIPEGLRKKYRLPAANEAIRNIHFPKDEQALKQAQRFLVYEELLMLQLQVQRRKQVSKTEYMGISHGHHEKELAKFRSILPFVLTEAQERVIAEITDDMEKPEPMNRLLQGDVGSGKTLVAAAALIKTAASGHQGVLMAPTEILAEQHYLKLRPIFQELELSCRLLSGSVNAKEKRQMYEAIALGEIDIVIGTHALLQDKVEFLSLGLVITDEQHRFGVGQRETLQSKGKSPDVLVMSATPIPRTLTLTVFGDLDLSSIDALPPGRQKIETYWVETSLRPRIYRFIRTQISEGRQVYVVCPLVEESEKLQTESAVSMAERLSTEEFPDLRVGLLHGRMKGDEKEQIMTRFRQGEIDILVATTVIEVGVDVPNATVMVIEGADRFGLAQLHQLRGRVGRGAHASYCILIADSKSEEVQARLDVLCHHADGFCIAEEDLRLRGPGEYLGRRQHGITNLKIADLIRDAAVMEVARRDAVEILQQEPTYLAREFPLLNEELLYRFGPEDDLTSLT